MQKTPPSVEAIAMVLTKGKLAFNAAGEAEVKLQLMLGQKSTLLDDQHPYAVEEVIQAIATNQVAFTADSLSSAEQISFSALLVGSTQPHLQLTDIRVFSADGNAAQPA